VATFASPAVRLGSTNHEPVPEQGRVGADLGKSREVIVAGHIGKRTTVRCASNRGSFALLYLFRDDERERIGRLG